MEFWLRLKEQTNLLPNLRAQLAKDLGLDMEAVPKRDLLAWLEDFMAQYIAQNGDLAHLLYRIDLDQSNISHHSHELAQQILEREAQKVIFRAQYSGKL